MAARFSSLKMSPTLVHALVLSVPLGLLLCGAITVFANTKSLWSFLQVVGAVCLVVVVLAHICEGLHLFPRMNWGLPNSVGHYLDLCSAVLGALFFPVGYLVHALSRRAA